MSKVINKTRISENTAKNSDTNQKNKSADANNEESHLAVKPVLPMETKKNVTPVVKNIQPKADAGNNQIAVEGSQVILDGSKSRDSDGKIESYHWQQITGPSIPPANVNDIKISFISPPVNQDAMLVFKLTVTDDKGSSDSAITTVKVVRNEEAPPVSSSDVADSSTSNLQNSSNRIEGVGNSTIEQIRP